jgi:nitroreductase
MESEGGHSQESISALRKSLLQAPLVIAVVAATGPHPKIPEWEQTLAVGAVCFNLLLAAHAMGYGGVWLTGWPTYNAGARAALGLSESESLAGLFHFGTQAQAQPERERPDMSARIAWF